MSKYRQVRKSRIQLIYMKFASLFFTVVASYLEKICLELASLSLSLSRIIMMLLGLNVSLVAYMINFVLFCLAEFFVFWKDDETQNDVKPERESWMMELPPERTKNFALAPRTFSMAVPSANMDRSSWTETPADRAKKEQVKRIGNMSEELTTIIYLCHTLVIP